MRALQQSSGVAACWEVEVEVEVSLAELQLAGRWKLSLAELQLAGRWKLKCHRLSCVQLYLQSSLCHNDCAGTHRRKQGQTQHTHKVSGCTKNLERRAVQLGRLWKLGSGKELGWFHHKTAWIII